MMLYCRYQAFLFDLNLISLPTDDIPQHNAQPLCTASLILCVSCVDRKIKCYGQVGPATWTSADRRLKS